MDISIGQLFLILGIISLVLITTLITVVLVQLFLFLRTVKAVADSAKRTTEILSEDLTELGAAIREHGFSVKSLISFFKNVRRKNK